MAQDRYEVRVAGDMFCYEFTSIGPDGRQIEKRVKFTRMEATVGVLVFNLAFGDLNETAEELNDLAVTNNMDTLKVLATVAHIVAEFTHDYPNAIIYATGSTESRNRLYQMAIKKYRNEIEDKHDVYGEIQDRIFVKFSPGYQFIGFAAMRKKM